MQTELDSFFALLARRTRLSRVVNASAFSKARSHLFANVFDPLNSELLRQIEDMDGSMTTDAFTAAQQRTAMH
ncbi:MAG: hypothetical protein U0989_04380 [Azonexus sp.]|nr:hypothetical protein [Azonexus sp.]MDZ4313984.1 hypothetical protein [Azonexus sp.]